MNYLIGFTAILLILFRAYSRKSLTPLGMAAATLVGLTHIYHPWSVFFTLLCVFFFAGTAVTKVKKELKDTLTIAASAGDSATAPRNHIQVFANSGLAALLTLVHAFLDSSGEGIVHPTSAFFFAPDALPYAIVAIYAAATADTFSSEIGILSKSRPVHIDDIFTVLTGKPRRVPPGTNGGVSLLGLGAGLGGSALIAFISTLLVPVARYSRNPPTTFTHQAIFFLFITIMGFIGTLADSWLGAHCQASVIDEASAKIVEAHGGGRVAYAGEGAGKRRVYSGVDLLDNNGVNFAMTCVVGGLALGVVGVYAVMFGA